MLFWTLAASLAAPALVWAQDPYAGKREHMVRTQIEARGVRNPAVLDVMRRVPRHLFMPENVRALAYADQPVPVGYGQTISQPYIVAFMTELLAPERTHKVLEIGTGSGYQAAVLSPLVGHVYTIEIVPELARSAAATLKKLGYDNITVRLGDGYKGWPEQAPFDRIILTAAPPKVPQELIDQLKPGGRLVAPEGASVFGQELVVIEKAADGKTRKKSVLPVMFVPMVRGPEKD
ncbi:MAG TPA: protein-L-isoaspartate(D-aspartate) O-methyltransferase [Bryobacteraceae bacterium]|nr:protein-L-isoaspartate(D-aspartate) O-methyltransferase [Bryobacteraceae bacterium]HOL71522.1 protein-L-isoaspartate(D-aspartate) O-methyltransferase [Bryobacteraceae bacterium]HOQ46325.1 protein-L-isoaspartate(D-aspartate) O-methyltransferase [Bryobacteraceae bacterium]HPQ17485.1 protein-L-isoaspartate(D-aspartate) O-methyltransferase [Bryobacteraceae bacterium]HPU72238.1 protein-L-isoaspartate(D-aspartate) O-methyltransferase [Bryobacteraceae bacterium]